MRRLGPSYGNLLSALCGRCSGHVESTGGTPSAAQAETAQPHVCAGASSKAPEAPALGPRGRIAPEETGRRKEG